MPRSMENGGLHIQVAPEVIENLYPRAARSARGAGGAGGIGLSSEGWTLGSAIDRHVTVAVRVASALRRVPVGQMRSLVPFACGPRAGDTALVQVEKIGKNTRLELANGRGCALHVGDVLAVVFGNRYATNQFEGYARAEGDECDMMSMGGLCGRVVSAHLRMPEPTKLKLLGALANEEGRPLVLRDFALPRLAVATRPQVTVVCGTSMDSGKTHTMVSLILGLLGGRRSVASIKLTGTACCRDTWKMHDAGASPVLDFVDGGYPSTYLCSVKELTDLYEVLHGHAAAQGVQHVVVEIADGLLQRETAALLGSRAFCAGVGAWVLAAGDPLAAAGAVRVMREAGIEPLAISGLVSCSPLGMREAAAASGVRCLTAEALRQGALNEALVVESEGGREVAQEVVA